MEAKKPQNPIAFPCEATTLISDKNCQDYEYGERRMIEKTVKHSGMTLRDYFAAKAMNTFAHRVSHLNFNDTKEWIAKTSYELADEMLKQREI